MAVTYEKTFEIEIINELSASVYNRGFCCKVSKRSLVFQDDSYLSRDS